MRGDSRLLKKTHMLRCAQSISRPTYMPRVRLRSSIFARLASEAFLSSLQRVFSENARKGGAHETFTPVGFGFDSVYFRISCFFS